MAASAEYTIEVVRAPKGAKRLITVALSGFAPSWKTEGSVYKVVLEAHQAARLLGELRKLYTEDQVTFRPIPPGEVAAQTTHVDPESGKTERSTKPVSRDFEAQVVPMVPRRQVDDRPDDEMEGSAIAWPYLITRPEDLSKLETIARERHKLKDGKRHIRLGLHGERNYLVEPVRGTEDPDRNQWRTSACNASGERQKLGSHEEWMGAIALIYAYEQSLVPAKPLEPAAPFKPALPAIPNPQGLKSYIRQVEAAAQDERGDIGDIIPMTPEPGGEAG